MKKLRILLFFILLAQMGRGQTSATDSTLSIYLVNLSAAFQMPNGDLSQRFGLSTNVKLEVEYKTYKNWKYGLMGGFIFGENVKQDPLYNMRTSEGGVISVNSDFALLQYFQRGFNAYGTVGKIIPVIGPNSNSGIDLQLGLGFLQHKIKIVDYSKAVPQLTGDYIKGYDKMSNGFSMTQFVGYYHFGNNNMTNFLIGIECSQSFTKNRRSWNYAEMTREDNLRFDYLFGVKIGWILPLYTRSENNYIFY